MDRAREEEIRKSLICCHLIVHIEARIFTTTVLYFFAHYHQHYLIRLLKEQLDFFLAAFCRLVLAK